MRLECEGEERQADGSAFAELERGDIATGGGARELRETLWWEQFAENVGKRGELEDRQDQHEPRGLVHAAKGERARVRARLSLTRRLSSGVVSRADAASESVVCVAELVRSPRRRLVTTTSCTMSTIIMTSNSIKTLRLPFLLGRRKGTKVESETISTASLLCNARWREERNVSPPKPLIRGKTT